MARAAEGKLEAVMDQPLAMQARGDADLVQEIDGALFEHAGANARQHIVAIHAFENDGVDAMTVQQLAEQQAGRASADDGDLSAQKPVRPGGLRQVRQK